MEAEAEAEAKKILKMEAEAEAVQKFGASTSLAKITSKTGLSFSLLEIRESNVDISDTTLTFLSHDFASFPFTRVHTQGEK